MPLKAKKTKSGSRKKKGGMSSLFACLGGCGGRVPRDELEEITQLDFRHYSLTEVPPDVFACECTLDTLFLDSNQLCELPRELFHCHGLQTLTLSDNELKTLPPAIASLTSLQSLDVSKNNLSDIPDSIKSCRELCSVDASVNPLCRLPEGFTQLVALKELFLNDTFLEYLPANFGRLVSLEVLELRDNQLNTLPKSLARLTKLRRLDIGSNELSQLPEVVGSLTSLTELWFDNNRVRSVAPLLGQLSALEYLDGCNNRIDSLPDEIEGCQRLSDLHLSGNHLKTLPSSLCRCTLLQTLRLDDNALCELPQELGNLSQLAELVVTQNDLESLPSSIGLLRCLHTLHADDNVLTSIPSEIGSCGRLSILTLASNRLSALPPELGHVASLRVLSVWDNTIRNLPVSFSKLKLLALWLSDNQAKPSVQLQTETDPLTGQKVLTCYMLPQQPQNRREEPPSPEQEEPFPMATWEERHRARSIIKFSFDEAELMTGAKLSRAPTPYPKELRALAKHARNLTAGGKLSSAVRDETKKEGEEGVTAAVVVGRRGEEEKKKRRSEIERAEETVTEGDGAVTAEYQAAATAGVQNMNEFISQQPIVKTATKTSPNSVMASACVPPIPTTAQFEEDKGLVPSPVEELPPQTREARAVLQSSQQQQRESQEQQQLLPAAHTELMNNTARKHAENEPPSSPSKSLVPGGSVASDDYMPSDLLAEALAVADDVASTQKAVAAEDPTDRSSTDSGYCRPSHNTNSLNDVSDQGSDLVSPVSSLPPETPTTPRSRKAKGAVSGYNSTSSLEKQPSNESSNSNSVSTPSQLPLSPSKTDCFSSSAVSSPSFVSSSYSVYSSVDVHRPSYHSSAVAGSTVLQQPRPGSLALASLAECGVLGDRAGQQHRPGSLAAPYNTLGIPSAPPPARALSAATGLNQGYSGLYSGSAAVRRGDCAASLSPSSRGSVDESPLAGPYSGSNVKQQSGGGLYTIQQSSPTSSNAPSGAANTGNSAETTYSPAAVSHIPGLKYSTPQSRIPMNKQISASSLNYQSSESSRIPSYTSQLPGRIPVAGEAGKRNLTHHAIPEPGNSRIPALSSSGRSYSNLGNKSIIQDQGKNNYESENAFCNGKGDSYNSKEAEIKAQASGSYRQTAPRESKLPLSPTSSNSNTGIKTPSQVPNINSSKFNGSALQNSAGKPTTITSPTGLPSAKSTGIPLPSYTRSNSGLSNSDIRETSRIPQMNTSGSFGKSNVSPHITSSTSVPSHPKSMLRSPYSPNTSFDSYKSTGSISASTSYSRVPNPLSSAPFACSSNTNSSSGYSSNTSSSSGIRSPTALSGISPAASICAHSPVVNQAINTPGLPPLPAPQSDCQRKNSGLLQQQRQGSRIPHFGAAPAGGVLSVIPDTQLPQQHGRQQQQQQPWMFGHHQNARVFPVVIEKDPGPGFTLVHTTHPDTCVFVSSVEPGGPASSALRPGDKLLQVDGESLATADRQDDVLQALLQHNSDTVTLLVSRTHE